MKDISRIFKKIHMLNPVSPVVHKVLALADDPESSMSDFVDLVQLDPAITANLLKTCNSAFFGLPVKVDSIQQAVTMLGQQRVVEMVLAQGLSENLKTAQEGYGIKEGELWNQSVATAMVARTLAEHREIYNLPAVYTAALLKDIGKVVLHDSVGHQLEEIQHLVDNKGLSFVEAEKRCIGMDHARLGGLIAKKWNFSSHMVFMIENHHLTNPEARNDPATSTIYLADMVAMIVGTGIGVDRLAYHVYETVFNDFFLTRDEIKSLVKTYKQFAGEVRQIFELETA